MKFEYSIKVYSSQKWADNYRAFLQELATAGFAGSKTGTIECEKEDIDQVVALVNKYQLELIAFKQEAPGQQCEENSNDEM